MAPIAAFINGSPSQAALGGVTPFEIDSNTVAGSGTDWVTKFAVGDVAVSNDQNFTGAAVVQSDVGSSSTNPSWLTSCVNSNTDTVFKNSTNITDADWTGLHETQSVTPKQDICQSYFSYDVVQTGARAGHVVGYLAFTRRVFNGDGSYYFLLTRGANPDVRVDGDIVIEVDYGSQGQAEGLRTATWSGAGTPVLGAYTNVGVSNANVDMSPVEYFAEMAIDLTALGLAPNVYELPTPQACLAFAGGNVISRTGNSTSATLKDDGEPVVFDFNVCGHLTVRKELTSAVGTTSDFPVTVDPPSGVTLPYPNALLRVPAGATSGGTAVDGNANPSPNAVPTGNPVTYLVPPRLDDHYNVNEVLTPALDARWDLVSVVCVNDRGTASPDDDETSDGDNLVIRANESVDCVITNEPAPVTINVDKNSGGAAGEWQVTLSPGEQAPVLVSDDGLRDFSDANSYESFPGLVAGSYTLTEAANGDPFRVAGWSCQTVGGTTTTSTGAQIGVLPQPGDVVNCVVTNTFVPAPEVSLVKTAAPTTFVETATPDGGPVVYSVTVNNDGTEPFTIISLVDNVALGAGAATTIDLGTALAGDSAGLAGATFVANDCADLVGATVAGGSTAGCSFSVAYADRNAGDVINDTAVVEVIDEFERTDSAQDDASVSVTDRAPVITVDKALAANQSIVAPGGEVTYDFTITNGPDAIEAITITSVTDDMSVNGGAAMPVELASVGGGVVATTCGSLVGTTLAVGESVGCSATIDTTVLTSLAQDDLLDNAITVTAVDNDQTEVTGSDDASLTVLGEPPVLTLDKTDNGASIDEPSGDVTFDLTITNGGTTEALTITSITDTVTRNAEALGSVTIDAAGITSTLSGGATLVGTTCDALIGTAVAPGASVPCSITLTLSGNAGDLFADVAVANAVDETGDPASDADDEDTPVTDVLPAISIVKTADPTSVPETGGTVTFTLEITNNSVSTDPLTLTGLTDTVFGDLFGTPSGVVSSTCAELAGSVVAPGDTVSCTIVADLAGNAGTIHTNIAAVSAIDDEQNLVTDTDDAVVVFTDVLPVISVTKTADPTSVPESGAPVTFTVVVTNEGTEAVTVNSIVDDVYGNLIGAADSTCVAGSVLDPAETYTCSFVRIVAQVGAETTHVNVVTAIASDDEQNEAADSDDAVVTITLLPPTVEVTKTDGGAAVSEEGGLVNFQIAITNTSFEPVTITALTDTITYTNPAQTIVANLLAPAAPVSGLTCDASLTAVMAPGATVICTFDVAISGLPQVVTDVVAVTVVDFDGQPASDDDDEDTPITDVLPAISIVKTADPISVPETGGTVTFTFDITNNSVSTDPLTLTGLTDDMFGDLFVVSPTCAELAGSVVAPGATVSCTLVANLAGNAGTSHTNVGTVSAIDDEENLVTDNDNAVVDFTDVLPEITVTKTANPTSVPESGAPVTFTVVVTNEGTEAVTVNSITDDVYGNLVGAEASSCVAGSVLDPGESYTCSFVRTVAQVETETSHVNVVTAIANDDDENEAVDDDDAVVTIALLPPTVEITKTDGGAFVGESGGLVNFRVEITNTSFEPVTITSLTDTITYTSPAQTIVANLLAPAAPVSGLSCDASLTAVMAPGDTIICTFDVAISGDPQVVTDVVAVTVVDFDGEPASDDDDEETPIVASQPPLPSADMAILKTASQDQVGASGGFSYTLDVVNRGPDTATAVVVRDLVPNSLTVVSATSSQFACSVSGNSVTCTKATMAINETGRIVISVTVPASAVAGTITNIANVSADTPDPDLTNNVDDAVVTVVASQPHVPNPPPVLPRTGADSGQLAATALALLVAGAVLALGARRRPVVLRRPR